MEKLISAVGIITPIAALVCQLVYLARWGGKVDVKIDHIKDGVKEVKNDFDKKIDTLKADIKEDIRDLKNKQETHNGWISKIEAANQSAKAAHHRIDELKERAK
jgi:peptidoglycan hydrolase CwlO-like protein